ncbi:DUF6559 family protein [Halopseudomonas maritima]|uniref:DUF6559 family protein n=1 Tax=Halopseudomonas maritima TaxID=2918528 RepID=UPI001EECB5B3|nr:DUF6559 family protein [Halopseudomonas maritima]UJJ31358.1 hypothetical protein HV822_16640 [Halopseudomonas maritima]
MLGFFQRRRLRRAFRRYLGELGPALLKRYGPQDQFTVRQVLATIHDLRLDTRFAAYAVALYRHEASSNCVALLGVDQPLLNSLRREIALALFSGNSGYTVNDVLSLTCRPGWQGGPAPDWMASKHGRTSL